MRMSVAGVACLVASAASSQPAADPGERAFQQCAACHTLEKGGAARVGPNLHGLFGRTAGTAAGFVFSPALKASGLVWDAKSLDAYIAAPTQLVPGTRMVQRVPDAAKRSALIAFLKAETER